VYDVRVTFPPSSAGAPGAALATSALLLSTACGGATLLLVGEALVACGGATTTDSAPSEGAGGGSAEFYAQSNVPSMGSAAGASYKRSVTFTAVGQNGCGGTSSRMNAGPCSVNPCLAPPPPDGGTEALPNGGAITIDGARMPSLTLEPGSDGAYAPNVVKGQLAWTAGGAAVTFQWAHLPGDPSSPGGSATLDTPPYIALTQGSAFAIPPTTLARDQDLTVEWTSDTAPTSADQVAVDLDSGHVQLACIFAATAGIGVIPASALGLVPAGAGTYNVHSKEGSTNKAVGGSQWSFGFNVDAQARTSSGLAKGAVTFD
jgi:hypothetical protein